MRIIEPKHDRIEHNLRWFKTPDCPQDKDCYAVDFAGVHCKPCDFFVFQPDAVRCKKLKDN
jgi:hypothetical protein